jgi:hypothetical protein
MLPLQSHGFAFTFLVGFFRLETFFFASGSHVDGVPAASYLLHRCDSDPRSSHPVQVAGNLI